ncbi:CIC11C00000004951 [Sungouiella intermedia]|uniref:CIC11C00000004951 n=1 Tax=Sungouiella intermedia TaxID=45354 RepID=A0A1L0D372_9ASCO|nr:CIC11C00000004951 [[Candida] intermedia]
MAISIVCMYLESSAQLFDLHLAVIILNNAPRTQFRDTLLLPELVIGSWKRSVSSSVIIREASLLNVNVGDA